MAKVPASAASQPQPASQKQASKSRSLKRTTSPADDAASFTKMDIASIKALLYSYSRNYFTGLSKSWARALRKRV